VPSLVDHRHRPVVRDQPERVSAFSRNRCPGSSGIGVRDRPDYAVRTQRAATLAPAQAANPTRFHGRRPEPPKLPTVAWINDPNEEVTQKAL
jgi:hypothetical protein